MLRRILPVSFILLLMTLFIACGGGGDKNTPGSPAGFTYSTTSAVYTEGIAITNNIPAVTGTVTSWEIEPELPGGLNFDTDTGIISGTPDTAQPAHQYIITATNQFGSSTATISITINLDAPKSLTYSTTTAVYTRGVEITGNIPTVTGTVTFWEISPELPGGLLIDPFTGVISGNPTAEQPAAEYTITAGNAYGSTSAVISIKVNLAPPAALSYSVTSAVYTKDAVIMNNVPTVTGTVTLWEISPELPDGLSIDPLTGVISGNPTAEQTAAEYTITAGNAYGSTSAVISITVNLAAPAALSYSTTSAVYTKDAVIMNNVPTVTGTVTSWSIDPALPNGLTLNTTTGVISGTPDTVQSVSYYTITAVNSGGSTTANISITVNHAAPAALSYSTTSAVYTAGAVIAENVPTVTGTVISWSIDPALPAGLTLNTVTGVISGTPENIQSSVEYTITASNTGGSATANITIAVNHLAPSALSYTTTSAVYTQGAVIAENVPAVTGTVTSWSVDPALPNGLTLNTATGVISGTPDTVQSSVNYTITASNSGGSTTAAISITVNIAAPADLLYSAPAAVYARNSVIIDNVPTVTGTVTSWSVDPVLPNGLILNTTTGVISGTPTALQSAADYTITAVNSTGSTSVTISITVQRYIIGQSFGGGIIFYIDGTGEGGLIAGTTESGRWASAYLNNFTLYGASGVAVGTGLQNSETINSNNNVSAASGCLEDVSGGYDDWFMPSKDELNLIYTNLYAAGIGGLPSGYYWSSSEYNASTAWIQNFNAVNAGGGDQQTSAKQLEAMYISVRAIIAEPTHLSYSTPSAFYAQNIPITDNTPSIWGEVSSWSINPSLPDGLSFDTSTGVISGTPVCEPQTAAEYIVTATNSSGLQTSVTISIAIQYFVVGQSHAGGIIFYIDSTGQHGLVAAPSDCNDGSNLASWGTSDYAVSGADGTAIGTGYQNTVDIVNGDTFSNKAADYCSILVSGGYDDWFLPSIDELGLMYTNLKMAGLGNFALDYFYWSSSESDNNNAMRYIFGYSSGNAYSSGKSVGNMVRAIRAF